MPRPHLARCSLWRLLGSLVLGASVAVLSTSAAVAQDSPYAYDDPNESFDFDPPFTDVSATNQDPGVTDSQTQVPNLSVPAPSQDIVPAVQANDVSTPQPGDPADKQVGPAGLPKTGQEIIERVAFALLLVAAGLVALDISRRRGIWAR